MDDWVSDQSPWTADPNTHQITDQTDQGTGSRYRMGSYQFLLEDAKANLLQKCEDKLVNKTDFYRLGYHVCDHDSDDRPGCSWDDQREWADKDVTIPDYVPTFVEE